MKRTKLFLVLLLIATCVLTSVFAQGAMEEAYQNGWDAAKADIPYSTNPGTSGWGQDRR